MSKPLVIVESPTKRNTIQKYLGDAYLVEASVGHVRDLPESAAEVTEEARAQGWTKLGVKVDGDFEPHYVIPARKKEQVAKLRALLREASEVLLATDEDREGESISWHLHEVLKPKVPVRRLVFHEITPQAIQKALANPRAIDADMVHAQEARRIVDRLYGFSVSPLVWKKVRPGLSAGRVQSVAVRLIVDRERARRRFVSAQWWSTEATFDATNGSFQATLVEVAGKRVATGKDFDELTGTLTKTDLVCLDEAAAKALVARLAEAPGTILKVDARPYKDSPSAPFTTSTLQQEANRKLRWSADRTMRVAQRLYENGWITYMRTDSVTLSDQALDAARGLIAQKYGPTFVPAQPRRYANRSKGAQEAHEAIRPAGAEFRPIEDAHRELGGDEAKLYELIWKRTVACQMADARGELTSVIVGVSDTRFSASGKTITFAGFRLAYVEGSDDPDAEVAQAERLLPALTLSEAVRTQGLVAKGHTTQPPARLTEATLVKELEQRGIGRPSTYAAIIETILARNYVFKRGNALVPTFTAFAVTELMERHLADFVDYDFTARMEEDLDRVAVGERDWRDSLRAFYRGPTGLESRIDQAEKVADPRAICSIRIGTHEGMEIVVRVGRNGPYLSAGELTANVPDDIAPDEVTPEWAAARLAEKAAGPRVIGQTPEGVSVYAMNGRFGPYVQLGEQVGEEKPPRASLLPGMKLDSVDLPTAIGLLSFPRTLATDDGDEPITVNNGRYGPFVRRGKESRSIPADLSPLTLTVAQALTLLAAPPSRRGAARRAPVAPLKEFGNDPVTGGVIKLMSGRFGPYITDGTTNATLPRGTDPEGMSPAHAVELLATKRAAGPPARGRFGKGARRPKQASSDAGSTAGTAAPKAAAKTPAAKATAGKASAPRGAKSTASKAPPAKAPPAKKPPTPTQVTTISAGKPPTVQIHAPQDPPPAPPPRRKPGR